MSDIQPSCTHRYESKDKGQQSCNVFSFMPVMKRFIITLICILSVLSAQGQSIWDAGHLCSVKESLDEPAHADALKAEPLSVMMKTKVPASGDRHDYMSLARYFWPDPEKPDGLPYINRDGHSNPELKELDRERLGETAERVTCLSLAYYFTDDERYARKAVELLRTWFLDEDTRMNPNLEYAQMIPGHNGGKGRCFHKALDFLVPYISEGGEERWPYEQIHGFDDVSRKLCKDLYRVAVRLDPSRKDYLEIFRMYADVAPDDLFNLLY